MMLGFESVTKAALINTLVFWLLLLWLGEVMTSSDEWPNWPILWHTVWCSAIRTGIVAEKYFLASKVSFVQWVAGHQSASEKCWAVSFTLQFPLSPLFSHIKLSVLNPKLSSFFFLFFFHLVLLRGGIEWGSAWQ